jgi:hypothetical protein
MAGPFGEHREQVDLGVQAHRAAARVHADAGAGMLALDAPRDGQRRIEPALGADEQLELRIIL